MLLTAHQPVYMPWLGLFHKIALADLFCYFDIAQYQTKDFNNRNKIKTHNGEIWISVPVESKNHFAKSVGRDPSSPGRMATKAFQVDFDGVPEGALLQGLHRGVRGNLDFAIASKLCPPSISPYCASNDCNTLGIATPMVKASDYKFQGAKSDLVLDMCVQLKADIYIFGAQGRDYADVESFRARGVEPYFQEYRHPKYRQLHGGVQALYVRRRSAVQRGSRQPGDHHVGQ